MGRVFIDGAGIIQSGAHPDQALSDSEINPSLQQAPPILKGASSRSQATKGNVEKRIQKY